VKDRAEAKVAVVANIAVESVTDSYEWEKMPYFLEEDLACHKAAASDIAMANAEVLGDSDDYHSIMDGLDSDISQDAIKEALKKYSPIDVD
jgi:hypothetical protein